MNEKNQYDGLDVHNFSSSNHPSKLSESTSNEKTTAKVNRINASAIKKTKKNGKIAKNNRMYRAVGIMGLSLGLIGSGAFLLQNRTEQVAHANDDYSIVDGVEVVERHESLTKEDFMRDFLYLNPGASDEQIIEALQNGEYEYYLEHNGDIKLHFSMGLFQKGERTPERYNEEVVPRIDDLMEQNNIEMEIEESHGMRK